MSQNGLWYDFDEFASMAGFHEGLDSLEKKGEAKWTNTATDKGTGGIHGLRYKVEKDKKNDLEIVLQHWVHWPGGVAPPHAGKKFGPQILTFKTETRRTADGRTEIRPVSAEWMGKTYSDLSDLTKLMHFLQETAGVLKSNIALNTEKQPPHDPAAFSHMQQRFGSSRHRDEIPNLYHIAQRCDMKTPFTLEGMYFNGEFNFGQDVKSDKPPLYPLQLLRAMLAMEADIFKSDAGPFQRSFTVPNPDTGGYEGVTYNFAPEGKMERFTVSCRVWNTDAKGKRQESELYKAAFDREGTSGNMFRLSALEMLGRKPDLTDHKGVARTIRAMKYIHLAIQRNEAPPISDIIHDHDLKPYLSQPEPPTQGAADPRLSIQVYGANTDAVFSEKEKSIGSNGMVMIQEFMKNGEWVRQGGSVDWGITFGDPERDHYHSFSHNWGRFLKHPGSPHIKPYVNSAIHFETHEHEDHLRGFVKFAKFGYDLPPVVLNAHTKNVMMRMMTEEKVDKARAKDILARCHVIKIERYKKPEKEKEVFQYGDLTIEQGYETIWSDDENCEKYFPVLEYYTKDHPDARHRVRVGPAGHSARAMMFEIDGVLYTGDYKLDQSLPDDIRTDFDWLRKCRETAAVHIQESTNATRALDFNPTLAEVKENRKNVLRDSKENRVFYDTIGSNAMDIETLCRAAGEIRLEEQQKGATELPYKYIIFAGQAIRNKYSDLNKSDDFKAMMNREYGIKTLHISSDTAQELLQGGQNTAGSFIVVMTGTQDEPLSVTHRVSRDLHDQISLAAGDVVIRGQVPIPGDNRKAVRNEQNNRYRHDFGCKVYDAAELADQGVYIYTSSHASRDDYKKIHELTGDLLKVLHHGGPAQLEAMKKIMDGLGARSVVPDKQLIYEVDRKKKDVAVIGETPEERVGYREIRSNPENFAEKGRQLPTVLEVKSRWQGDVADSMYRFEAQAKRRTEERGSALTSRGSNLSNDFNQASGADFPPIGILHPGITRPYHENHKNIGVFIDYDTETTGVNPAVDVTTDASFVASTPDGKELARKTLRLALPRYMMPTVGALLVTKTDDPKELYKGMKLRRFIAEVSHVFTKWSKDLAKDNVNCASFGYRSNPFDNQLIMRQHGMALSAVNMKPMATHGNLHLDVYNLYTAMIAFAPDKVSVKRDKDGNTIRTLREACLQNGVEYNDKSAHGSEADTVFTGKLRRKLQQLDPDIFEQMLMNTDFSSSRASPMIDHILGQGLHLNDNAPVFGYVDMRDRTCTPRLGALVTIDTSGGTASDAIVVDLAKADIHALEELPDYKLLELLNDPDGPFAVIKLNSSPCLFPAQFVFNNKKVKAKAVGNMPKTTLQARANALRKIRSGMGPGRNLIQRIQHIYPESALCRRPKAVPVNDNGPKAPASKTFTLPADRIFSLFDVLSNVNQTKNKYHKAAARLLRDIQPSEQEFKRDFHKESFWKEALHRVRVLSADTHGQDRHIEDVRFLIEWLVDDINPSWLPESDRRRMNALKSSMLHGPANATTNTIEKFMSELERIEGNKDEFEKLVGTGPEAQKRWKTIKANYIAFAEELANNRRFVMTDAKREIVREERKIGSQQGAFRRKGWRRFTPG